MLAFANVIKSECVHQFVKELSIHKYRNQVACKCLCPIPLHIFHIYIYKDIIFLLFIYQMSMRDVCYRRDKLWICMEFCGGGSLQDIYHSKYLYM